MKHQDHFDVLTSIPALINRSYYCCLCDKGYDVEGATHHNCCRENCPACLRTNKTCPNYAAWIKPTLECPNGNCKFYGQDYFEAHKKKGKKKDDKSICEIWRKCLKCSAEFHFDPTKLHECYHVTCTNCGEFKHVNHRCFIQLVQLKKDTAQVDGFEDPMAFQNEDDDDNEEKGPPPPPS